MSSLNDSLRSKEDRAKELLLILANLLSGGLITESRFTELGMNVLRSAATDALELTNQSVRGRLLPQAETAITIALILDRLEGALESEAHDITATVESEGLEAVRQRITQSAWFSVWGSYGAAIKRISQLSGKLINWIVVPDERVCEVCLANEAGSPYTYETLPAYPSHVSCRCTLNLL